MVDSRGAAGTLVLADHIDPRAPLAVCLHGIGCDGRYFQLNGNSWIDAASGRGLPCLVMDRPGYGRSAPALASPLESGAAAIFEILDVVARRYPALGQRPIALVGHSFGGAVALTAAKSLRERGELAAVCLAGIGDVPNPEYGAAFGGIMQRPAPYWLFGPGSTYDWRGVTALRASSCEWLREEIEELRDRWSERWMPLASTIEAPVHFRLAEHERIWDATAEGLERMSLSFTSSPLVDAAILPDGGHLYEVHTRGPELTASQVAFICAAAGLD